MALIVQKYGGTSVGSIERIAHVAKRVAQTKAAGHQLIVVVSAIGGETDRLLEMGRALSDAPVEREMDVLVSTGEQVTSALLSIALEARGIRARSLQGHQARILTDGVHTRARIKSIESTKINEALGEQSVVVMPGFQGVDADGNITTLGRGGSDTSAVAIAAAAGADLCEIYTDVEGVYTTDPNLCAAARKVQKIHYEEMLELASLGAKVLQIRSVELAMKYNVPLHVRSTFSDAEGTMVVGDDMALESMVVSGVALDKNAVRLTVRNVPNEPGAVVRIFEPLAEQNISVDMIVQPGAAAGAADLTFTIAKPDVDRAMALVEKVASSIGAGAVDVETSLAKVSIVGLGMRTHAGVAARMFRILADAKIRLEAISTSEIKVSCLVNESQAQAAVQALHEGFGLSES